MHLQNAFFDCVLRDQPMDDNGARLSDAMRPVRGLIFHRRVPPRVHQEDVIGCCQIEPGSARAQRCEHYGHVAVLEAGDYAAAIARAAVEAHEGDAGGIECRSDPIEQLRPLREDEGAVVVIARLLEASDQEFELRGFLIPGFGFARFRVGVVRAATGNEVAVAGGLAKTQQDFSRASRSGVC